MIGRHIAYYFGSKGIAAILNVVTMALFVRMGGAETYGGFVLFTAIATIVYGLALQWLRFSFFACYRDDAGPGFIFAYLGTQAVGFALVLVGLAIATSAGLVTPTFDCRLVDENPAGAAATRAVNPLGPLATRADCT